jgi:hypothetical protein
MRGNRHRSRLVAAFVAALLCLAAVGAVVPQAGAQNGAVDGDIRQTDAGGLAVEIQNGTGPFQGQNETVTINVAGASIEQDRAPTGGSYTYQLEAAQLADAGTLATDDLSNATVTVEHESGANFSRTGLDLRYTRFADRSGSFTDDGRLRVGFGVAVGIPEGTTIPVTVAVDGTTADVDGTLSRSDNTSAVVIDRGTLDDLGVLDAPREVTVEGRTGYLDGSTTVDVGNVAAAATTAERDSGRLSLSNPLFVEGRTYVVDGQPANDDGQYLVTVDAASDGELRLNSSALLVASEIEVTVERKGKTLLDSETVAVESRALLADPSDDRTTVSVPALAETGRTVAALWVNTNESGVQHFDASLNTSTGTLSLGESASLPADTTALLIEFANGGSAYATLDSDGGGGDGDTGDGTNAVTGPLGGLFQSITSDLFIFAGVAAIFVLGIVVGAVVLRRNRRLGLSPRIPFVGSSGGSSPGTSPDEPPTVNVTVDVVDEQLGDSYAGAEAVVAREVESEGHNQMSGDARSQSSGLSGTGRPDSPGGRRNRNRARDGRTGGGIPGSTRSQGINTTNDEERINLTGGEGSTELEVGTWAFEVVEADVTIARRQVQLDPGIDRDRVPISVQPREINVRVTGGLDNEPLEGARVRAEPDVGTADPPKSLPTDPNGQAAFRIPRSASAVTFAAEYDDLPGEQTTVQAEHAAKSGATVELTPELGTLSIGTSVGDREWAEVDVEVTPVDGDAVAYAEPGTITTEESAQARQEVPVGRYELAAHPQISGLETERSVETVTVEADRTTSVTLSIDATFSLSNAQQKRQAALRDRIEALSSEPDHDVAIPYYYGTVLSAVLDLIDELETSPERALEANVEPGSAVDAVLSAVDEGIGAVEGAMSEWRNIKLFRGIDATVVEASWQGDVDLETFLDRATEGADHQRRALRDRLAETDEFLDKRWSEVGEIGPARMVHDEIGDLARQSGDVDDELTAVAQAYVGVCLLDAVEELFDHDALRERLNSGGH